LIGYSIGIQLDKNVMNISDRLRKLFIFRFIH